jgi:hypothetical protein
VARNLLVRGLIAARGFARFVHRDLYRRLAADIHADERGFRRSKASFRGRANRRGQ